MGTWAHQLQRSGSVKTAHPGPDLITFKLTYGRDHHIYTPSLIPLSAHSPSITSQVCRGDPGWWQRPEHKDLLETIIDSCKDQELPFSRSAHKTGKGKQASSGTLCAKPRTHMVGFKSSNTCEADRLRILSKDGEKKQPGFVHGAHIQQTNKQQS